jgi:hypothetical protein
MRRPFAFLLLAAPLAAQSADNPLTTSGTAKTIAPPMKVNDGGSSSPKIGATQFLATVRDACQLLTNDGKLFAACDNSTATGKARLPRTLLDWQKFADRVYSADREVNGKPRALVVLNQGEPMVELTRDGRLVPRK